MAHSARHEVIIVVFDGMQSLDATGPLEVFTGACRAPGSRYRVRTASPGGEVVTCSSGVGLVPSMALEEVEGVGTLVVPGGEGAHEPGPGLVEWVRALAERAGRVWTSAGVTSGIDVALAVVEEDLGRRVALDLARNLVVFLVRPGGQSQFSTQLAVQVVEREEVRQVQYLVEADPGAHWSVARMAERAGLSVRQFSRVFTAQVGCGPGRYVERVRLEWARRRLEEGAASVVAIARGCGFGTGEALRKAFVRHLGCAPLEYRERFGVGAASKGDGGGR